MEGDRHPPHVRSPPNLSAAVAPMSDGVYYSVRLAVHSSMPGSTVWPWRRTGGEWRHSLTRSDRRPATSIIRLQCSIHRHGENAELGSGCGNLCCHRSWSAPGWSSGDAACGADWVPLIEDNRLTTVEGSIFRTTLLTDTRVCKLKQR